MPGTDLMVAFAIATFVFGYVPGPGMLYATAQTLAGGRRRGALAALGLHIGGFVHTLAAAFGLALVFEAIPTLYVVLKLAGAAYLIWLGLGLWRMQPAGGTDLAAAKDGGSFWQSITVEVLNPKTALFYVAFLPQFTDPTAGLPIWAQLLVLGWIVNVVFSSADLMCVLLAGQVQKTLAQSDRATL